MSPPPVSVIIAARNDPHGIRTVLEHLARQDLPGVQVLVADDASGDDTGDVARSLGAEVVRTERWAGAYTARNLALARARGEVVAFTDADCAPRPDWLSGGLAAMEELGADLLAGEIDVPLSERPGPAELLDFARYLDQQRAVEEAGFGATANLLVRRRVFDELGPFLGETISGADRELCQRATAAGFRLAFSPRARVVHPPRRRPLAVARRGFRDGVARAQLRRLGFDLPAIWRRPGAWFPSALVGRSPVYGIERLDTVGYRPSPRERRLIAAAEWTLVQLPMVAGSIVGELRERRR